MDASFKNVPKMSGEPNIFGTQGKPEGTAETALAKFTAAATLAGICPDIPDNTL